MLSQLNFAYWRRSSAVRILAQALLVAVVWSAAYVLCSKQINIELYFGFFWLFISDF